MKAALILFLAAVALVCAHGDHDHDHDHHDDDGHDHVLTLDTSNFDSTIAKKPLTLVEFYAPWCGHCKKLAPEYEKAAADLFNEVPLAKVDCTKEKDLCTKYGVQGFPTLKFFRDDGSATEYQSGRTQADIVKAVRRQNAPAFALLNSAEDLDKAKESADVLIVGHFKDADAQGASIFKTLANQFRNDHSFAIFADPKASNPRVVAHRKFDEPEVAHSGEHSAEALEAFIRRESFPLLTEIGPENYAKFVERGYPLFWAFLSYDDDLQSVESSLREVAKDFRQVSFVKLDGVKWATHAKNFGLSDALPGFVIEDRTNKKKYVYPENKVVASDLKTFLRGYTDGTLTPTLKSQDAPESNDGPVTVVVGKTFDQIVLDSTKDVLVEFYAPWCGHCKSLAPKYDELGKEFQQVESVVIAKVDATENDTPAEIQGFPTILFYPANDKTNPLTYSGERSQKAMSDYIKEHASTLKKGGAKPHDDL